MLKRSRHELDAELLVEVVVGAVLRHGQLLVALAKRAAVPHLVEEDGAEALRAGAVGLGQQADDAGVWPVDVAGAEQVPRRRADLDAAVDVHERRAVEVQQQARAHDGDGAHGHAQAGEGRGQPHVRPGEEDAAGDGHADEVVEHCQHEVELDALEDGAAEVQRHDDVREAAADEDDVGGVHGHGRAGPDGYADVRLRQRRRVVDAVADHGDDAVLVLQLADGGLLVSREAVGVHVGDVDAQALRHVPGDRPVVARAHVHRHARALERCDGARRVVLDGIGDAEDAEHAHHLLPHEHRGHAAGPQVVRLGLDGLGHHQAGALHELLLASAERRPVPRPHAHDAHADLRPEAAGDEDRAVRGPGDVQLLRQGAGADGVRNGVLRGPLDGGGGLEELVPRCEHRVRVQVGAALGVQQLRRGVELGHDGLARGERARLVQHDGAQGGHALQRVAALDEHAVARRDAGADHDGGGRRQAERARAGDDDDGDAKEQREEEGVIVVVGHPLRGDGAGVGQDEPGEEGDEGDGEHHRHEDTGGAIGKRLDGRLGHLRLRHEPDDLGHEALRAHLGRDHPQRPVLVHGAAVDGVAGLLALGHGLARDGRLVHVGLAVLDLAVARDARARLHAQQVAGLQVGNGHLLGVVAVLVGQAPGRLRLQLEQRRDGVGRVPPRHRL
mmetsp:Transcript_1433/g.3717  ORF Transcript_1433/g.3717 Transcript_1433/m.3717 type:complete len:672 (-) Transcript_1433:1302-3317(-)